MFIIDFGERLLAAFTHAASDILGGVLALVGVGILLSIGWFGASMAASVVRWVGTTLGIERFIPITGAHRIAQRFGFAFDPLEMLAQAVFWVVALIFFVTACYTLQIPFITATVQAGIRWLPSFAVALMVMSFATVVAYGARKVVRHFGGRDKAFLADLTFGVIMGVALFIALAVVAVPFVFLTIGFGAIMLALSLGGGVAIGLGGRNLIQQLLDSWFGQVAARRAEKARDSLHAIADPARTIVPVQKDISSFSLRDQLS